MTSRRIWEIDFLRTLAILLMVVFHFVYDLNEYLGVDVDYLRGFWYWEGKAAALLFIFVSGISSGFSRKLVKRGLLVLGIGLGITGVTYFIVGDMYIRYGILHFLGTCMLLYPLLKGLNSWVLFLLGAAVAYFTPHIGNMTVNTSLLLPLGIRYPGFITVDYYPLFPYLAVFVLGIIVYKLFYHKKQSLFPFSLENKYVTAVSRNSLLIYVLHQPILVGGLMLYKLLQ